jgi:SAM-dependent methyltransferase
MHCSCGDYGAAARRQFTEQIAARDVESYRAKGPGTTTRRLRDGLIRAGLVDGVVLDIGAGIGALTFELLDAGATRAIAVDASPAYIAAGSREAARRGRAELIQFIAAEFLSAASEIPATAIVALDRVVCCYPVAQPLLAESLSHAERVFAFSYPRDLWYVRIWNRLVNAKRRLTGNPFRTYIHSAAAMSHTISGAGFGLVSRKNSVAWSVDVYTRSMSGPKQSVDLFGSIRTKSDIVGTLL